MDEPEKLVKDIAAGILESVQTALADEWDSVSDETKDYVRRAAKRVGDLTYRKLVKGEDVEQQLKLVYSVVADFKAAGRFKSAVAAQKAEAAFWVGVQRVGESLSKFFLTLAKGAISGVI